MDYSAQRVRTKTRAAIKRREDIIEQDELESGELNLIPYLDMVTNLMLFVLASVTAGLIRTFASIGDANPADRQKKLSDGISEAMYNTAFGLTIALICMVGHLLLSGAMKKVVADLEAFSLRFENLLADGGAAAAQSRAPGAPTEDENESP